MSGASGQANGRARGPVLQVLNLHIRHEPFDERVAFDESLDVVLKVLLGDVRFDEALDDVDGNDFGALEARTLNVMRVAFFDLYRQILEKQKGQKGRRKKGEVKIEKEQRQKTQLAKEESSLLKKTGEK